MAFSDFSLFQSRRSNPTSSPNKGNEFDIIKKGSDGFWLARNEDGDEKWIPATHVEVKNKSNAESDEEEDGQDFETLLEEARKGVSGAYAPIAQK
ncbi:hypothetical protein HK104_007084 [Borealophlyctis nickersoniae]|nr:hypothetical protein HK104_007084 [Borealophlyctis nickersoniae]